MKKILFISFCLFTLFACRKDTELQTVTTIEPEPTVVFIPNKNPVTASVFGTVVDQNNQPIEGAAVRLGNQTRGTDESGQFIFSKVNMDQAGTYIRVYKHGYFNGSTRFFPKAGSQNYTTIRMMEEIKIGTFEATEGGTLNGADGLQVEFQANGVFYTHGPIYDGTVSVYAKWIDPKGEFIHEEMPGNLQGVNTDEEEVVLETFGMIVIEIKTNTGQRLQLGGDKKATLSFPLSAELLSVAPATIPLWYFDEKVGIWVEEGQAQLQGNHYVGEVAHFSFWNCDAPFPLIELSGRLVNADGIPLANAVVNVERLNATTTVARNGFTDNDGFFSGKVPLNELLRVSYNPNVYLSNCGWTDLIEGTFSEDTDLGDLIVTLPEQVQISGSIVDCSADPVAPSIVNISLGSDFITTFYFEEAEPFDIVLSTCEQEELVYIEAIDVEGLMHSDVLTFPIVNGVSNVGALSACGNGLDEFVKITVDGVSSVITEPMAYFTSDTSYLIGSEQVPYLYFHISFNETPEVGTFDSSIVSEFDLRAESSQGPIGSVEGVDFEPKVDEVIISEFGNVNEKVIGSILGTAEVFNVQTQQLLDLPYTIRFEIYRDE